MERFYSLQSMAAMSLKKISNGRFVSFLFFSRLQKSNFTAAEGLKKVQRSLLEWLSLKEAHSTGLLIFFVLV